MLKNLDNNLLNYAALLLLVLFFAVSVTACGNSINRDVLGSNTQEVRDDSKNATTQTDYEISGFGVITTSGDHYDTSLQIDQVSLTGGELSFSDWNNRLDFTSTAITSISVTGSTAEIKADVSVTDINGIYTGSIDLTLADGDPDTFGLTIRDSTGNELYTLNPQPIDMQSGNFTISIL